MPQHLWLVHTCNTWCGPAHTVQWLRFSLTEANQHSQVFYPVVTVSKSPRKTRNYQIFTEESWTHELVEERRDLFPM
jgi:phenolic acid decarboxylase